jgi:formylglycine-generating enzyme required for sulfatase activity
MGHNNKPRMEIIERPFLLGETEITQELYQAVMETNHSYFKNNPRNPVERVSWYDAILFCNELSRLQGLDECYALKDISTTNEYGYDPNQIMSAQVTFDFSKNGYRLPIEKEWEYAAKAGTQNLWSGTDDVSQLGDYAWLRENSEKSTHPIATKKPNEWGFYDMSGNVYEWCWDKYNPKGADADRVYRGGSWGNYASNLRSANRYYTSPFYRVNEFGFRVCRAIVN